jgi:hypothetical protein
MIKDAILIDLKYLSYIFDITKSDMKPHLNLNCLGFILKKFNKNIKID